MQIRFGESVRRLRREKGLTQEQLAAQLSVTFQTISNWERDESWPDLSMLPVLAGFFGVSTDDLLGVNEEENERRIQEILGKYNMLGKREWTWDGMYGEMKGALREFPREYRLWVLFLRCVISRGNSGTAAERRACLPEAEPVYENILERCTHDGIRMEAKFLMCCVYHSIAALDPEGGAAEQALAEKIISELPSARDSRERLSTYLLYPRPDERRVAACQDCIDAALELIYSAVHHMARLMEPARSELPVTPERIGILRGLIAVYEAIFPDGDYGSHTRVGTYWLWLTVWYAKTGDLDDAFGAFARAVEIACDYDALPRVSEHTSPMMRDRQYEKLYEGDARAQIRQTWAEKYPFPEAFKADPRFGEILSKLG